MPDAFLPLTLALGSGGATSHLPQLRYQDGRQDREGRQRTTLACLLRSPHVKIDTP
jgi:hypothetical protein